MNRAWIIIAVATLLSGCATYRHADGYYVENAPTGGTVYRTAGTPWVTPYYNPFFGSYLPAYGDAPYVYEGAYPSRPVVVHAYHDRDRDRDRHHRRWATPPPRTTPGHAWPTSPRAGARARDGWRERSREANDRRHTGRGGDGRSEWRGPRPATERSAPVRRPAHVRHREETRRRHERRH